MSNTRDTGFLRNAIQVTNQGVTFVSGSTTLMSISSSGAVTTTGVISGSNALSASFSLNSALLNGIGSVGFTATASFLAVSSSQQQISSSQQQISASLLNVVANYATTGSNSFRANQSITGSLVVSSTITAQTLVVQTVTSSIVYSSGSNIFGNALTDRQTFTGSVNITGSQTVFGNVGINYAPQSNIRSYIYDNSANYGLVVQQDGSGAIAQFSGNSGAVRMYISASGYVGIGVTNPTRQLFVNDTVFFDNAGNGSTTNPSVAIGSTSLGISYLGGSNMALLTGGSTKMFISSSGIIGIGTSSPVEKLNLLGGGPQYIVLTNTAADGVTSAIQGGIVGQARGYSNNFAKMASILFVNNSTYWYKGDITFNTNDSDGTNPAVATTERMRITSAGIVQIGGTNAAPWNITSGTVSQITINDTTNGFPFIIAKNDNLLAIFNRVGSNGTILEFKYNATVVGSISTNANSLPSDLNFKKDITDMSLGLNLITKLRPVHYRHKFDNETEALSNGIIAQELEQSLLECGVEKNSLLMLQHKPNEKEGESQYWLDYTKIIPVLTKAIQELKAENDSLKEILQRNNIN